MRCHVRVSPFAPTDRPELDDDLGVTVTTDLDGNRHLDLPVVLGSAANGGEQRKALLRATRYDSLYDGNDQDDTVVEEVAVPLLEAVQAGEKAALFAYGQTGTGKTYNVWKIMLPRLGEMLFRSSDASVRVACLQIYNEQLEDLLAPSTNSSRPSSSSSSSSSSMSSSSSGRSGWEKVRSAHAAEGGNAVLGLRWVRCTSEAQLRATLDGAASRRQTSATRMNSHSSRAHAVVLLQPERAAPEQLDNGMQQQHVEPGALAVVDLAGSERIKTSGASGRTQREAIAINASLHALSNVVSALASRHPHVPVRASKLTMVLEGHLRRGARLSLLVCLSPSPRHLSESTASLEFARRALQVVLTPPAPPKRPPPEPAPAPMTRLEERLEERLSTNAERRSLLPTAHATGVRHVTTPGPTPPLSSTAEREVDAEAASDLRISTAFDTEGAMMVTTPVAAAAAAAEAAAAAAAVAAVDAAAEAAAAASVAVEAQRAVVQEEVRREVEEMRREVRREVGREVGLLDAEREGRHELELGLLRQLLKVCAPSRRQGSGLLLG